MAHEFLDDEYELKLLLANQSFMQEIVALRTKWEIPAEGFANNKGANAWSAARSDGDREELQADLGAIIDAHNLSDRWALPLRQYLVDNIATRLRAAPTTEFKFDYDGEASDPKNIRAVWIKVDADTTQREVTAALKQAKTMLPSKRKKQAYTYLDHALRAKELKASGVTWAKVAKLMNEEFGTTYDENYVIKLVSRLNSHL